MGKGAMRGLSSLLSFYQLPQPELVILVPKGCAGSQTRLLSLSPALHTPFSWLLHQTSAFRVLRSESQSQDLFVQASSQDVFQGSLNSCLEHGLQSHRRAFSVMFLGPHFPWLTTVSLFPSWRLRSILTYNRKNKHSCRCFPALLKTMFLTLGSTLFLQARGTYA